MTDLRKHVSVLLGAALLLLYVPSAVPGQESAKPITEKGLVSALTIGGLAPQELVEIIDRRGVDFSMTPEVEQQLRAAGATDVVVEAARAHCHQAGLEQSIVADPSPAVVAPVPAHAASSESRSLPSEPGVFYRDGENWNQLRPEAATWHHEGLVHDLNKGGLLHAEMSAQVAGTHSPITMHSPASFLIRTGKSAMLQDYLLVHLHEKNDNRNFKVAPSGKSSKDAVDFRPAKIGDDVYEINFTQGTGEYAFFTRSTIPSDKNNAHDGQVLTFRIIEEHIPTGVDRVGGGITPAALPHHAGSAPPLPCWPYLRRLLLL